MMFSSPAADLEKEECDIVYSVTFLYITYVEYFVYIIYFYMQSNQRSSDVSTVPWGQKYCVIKSKQMIYGCYWICHPIGGVSTKRGRLSPPQHSPEVQATDKIRQKALSFLRMHWPRN